MSALLLAAPSSARRLVPALTLSRDAHPTGRRLRDADRRVAVSAPAFSEVADGAEDLNCAVTPALAKPHRRGVVHHERPADRVACSCERQAIQRGRWQERADAQVEGDLRLQQPVSAGSGRLGRSADAHPTGTPEARIPTEHRLVSSAAWARHALAIPGDSVSLPIAGPDGGHVDRKASRWPSEGSRDCRVLSRRGLPSGIGRVGYDEQGQGSQGHCGKSRHCHARTLLRRLGRVRRVGG